MWSLVMCEFKAQMLKKTRCICFYYNANTFHEPLCRYILYDYSHLDAMRQVGITTSALLSKGIIALNRIH